MNEHYKFELIPLPYPYNALEPFIDRETMSLHHNKHLKTYVDNLNKALAPYPKYHNWSLEQLIVNNSALPMNIRTTVKNNAGGVYNHNLYFTIMGSKSNKVPIGKLADAINKSFGSYEEFKKQFTESALTVFGSGYAWLVTDRTGKVKILQSANQDTPLPLGYCPIFLIDVWEHAYYLKYQNRRRDYINNWYNVINWEQAEKNYGSCLAAYLR